MSLSCLMNWLLQNESHLNKEMIKKYFLKKEKKKKKNGCKKSRLKFMNMQIEIHQHGRDVNDPLSGQYLNGDVNEEMHVPARQMCKNRRIFSKFHYSTFSLRKKGVEPTIDVKLRWLSKPSMSDPLPFLVAFKLLPPLPHRQNPFMRERERERVVLSPE
jgi:hypothetical protein